MVLLITRFDITQDLQSFFRRSRINDHFLETTFQRTVFLDILTIFIQSSSANALNLTTSQRRFQHIRRIHRPGSGTSANNRMNLIDKEDDIRVLR